jgi:hypothetical protein
MSATSNFFQTQIYIFQASESLKIIYMVKICHHFKYFYYDSIIGYILIKVAYRVVRIAINNCYFKTVSLVLH